MQFIQLLKNVLNGICKMQRIILKMQIKNQTQQTDNSKAKRLIDLS